MNNQNNQNTVQQYNQAYFWYYASRMEALNWPIGPGNILTFRDPDGIHFYVKSMGFSPYESPSFEVFTKEQQNNNQNPKMNREPVKQNDIPVEEPAYNIKEDRFEALESKLNNLADIVNNLAQNTSYRQQGKNYNNKKEN